MRSEAELRRVAEEICPGSPLDIGIVHAVKILQDIGLRTFESCHAGDGHTYQHPTVRFFGSLADGWRALAACQDHGLPIRQLDRSWDMEGDEPSGPYWQIVFSRRLD